MNIRCIAVSVDYCSVVFHDFRPSWIRPPSHLEPVSLGIRTSDLRMTYAYGRLLNPSIHQIFLWPRNGSNHSNTYNQKYAADCLPNVLRSIRPSVLLSFGLETPRGHVRSRPRQDNSCIGICR